ncbi:MULTISPECIES: hypothetical protein [Gulbenkiania]|uniref:Uncharacterized protein n=2 Tax=Gulbenkiania TaxID=397456 RepID=A0A0K6GXN8_9NEIS|nr:MULTISPECIES: hypothetical protein [Gulbenkiania]TCW32951.1 hypothetical protein EV669_102250 [Gulbenkiania mobilis]CUA83340.1 hypothetical protein Ga0061063_1694 [Gulbenkiania indica]
MALHPDRINRFLPATFSNGTTVRRFAKHCPRCRNLVGAEDMHGVAGLVQDRLFLAARARCPACSHGFAITCAITNDKRVHRVLFPNALFALWLRLALRNMPPRSAPEWIPPEPPVPPANHLADSADIQRSDEVIGRLDGRPIHAWIEHQGTRYRFERTLPPGSLPRLGESEVLFDNRLVYRQGSA